MHLLGVNLPDFHVVRFALTRFYGIGDHMAHRLCARLQVHDRCKVRDLSPFQTTSLSTFLSSPSTALPLPRHPLAPPNYTPPPSSIPIQELQEQFNEAQKKKKVKKMKKKTFDRLRRLKIESELRNEIRENIGHHRMIGSYIGRRHAMNLPVRGQNTQNNAVTAKKLNKLDRY